MGITTVKHNKGAKAELKGTYEGAVRSIAKRKKKGLKKELIGAYKNMGKKDMEILEEWEVASIIP